MKFETFQTENPTIQVPTEFLNEIGKVETFEDASNRLKDSPLNEESLKKLNEIGKVETFEDASNRLMDTPLNKEALSKI